MAVDATLPVRKAVVRALRADGGNSAIVAARVYPQVTPDPVIWPFQRVQVTSITPRRATCLDGSTVALTVHCFRKGPAEDECAELSAAASSALDGRSLPLPELVNARLYRVKWLQTQIIRDSEEATGWHGIVDFEARVQS